MSVTHTASFASAIVFIDRSLPDFEQLAAAVKPGTEIILLDASQDGLQQIAQALAGRSGVDAVHVLSHGSAGALELGSAHVTLDSLAAYGDAFGTIRAALAEGADLLLYGCDVAQGAEGQAFIEALAAATGADVAASTGLTGSALLGGDWELEATVGQMQTASLGSGGALAGYAGIMEPTPPLDEAVPMVSAIEYVTSETGVTNADALVYQVTFDEAVQNVDATDFTVTGPTGSTVAVDSEDGITYAVTISNGNLASYNGAVTLGFAANQDIDDLAGNRLDLTFPPDVNQVTYQLDNHAPTVASIVRNAAATTNADSVTWTVTFSESVQNIGESDFSVSGSSATVTEVTGSGTTYQVTASGGDLDYLDGQVTLGFAGGQGIADGAGNALVNTIPTGTSQPTYTLDNTAPSFISATVNGATLVLTYSEALDGAIQPSFMDFTVGYGSSQAAVIDVAVDGAARTVTLTLDAPVPPGVSVSVAYIDPNSGGVGEPIRDGAGNAAQTLIPTNVVNDTPAANHAPTINDYFSASVSTGVASALPDYLVGDADGDNLTVTLTASNGTINGLIDADGNPANGIQLQGGASVINAALAQATFTATNNGTAAVTISVTDGKVGTAVTATSYLAATSPEPAISGGTIPGSAISNPDRTSLVTGADGNMYMSAFDSLMQTASILKWDGSAWSTAATLSAAELGYDELDPSVTIGVDQYGKIHALTSNDDGKDADAMVTLAIHDGTGWSYVEIERLQSPGGMMDDATIDLSGASIVVTPDNIVNISYHRVAGALYDAVQHKNFFITNASGGFTITTSDFGNASVTTLQQFDGPDGHSYVLQADHANGGLIINKYLGGAFVEQDVAAISGTLVGAVTDASGQVVIVTGDYGQELLAWTQESGTWISRPIIEHPQSGYTYVPYTHVDSQTASGRTGLVKGLDGNVYLAVYDDDGDFNYTSRILRLEDGAWVDGRTDIDDFNALIGLTFAVDASGNVMIVNTNESGIDLSYIFGHDTDFEGDPAADTTAPVLMSAVVTGTSLVLTYDEALDSVRAPDASAFTVNVGGHAVAIDTMTIDALLGTVTLKLANAVQPGQVVTVSYADNPNGIGPLQDAAGNDAAFLVNEAVTNHSADTLAPTLTSAVVTGASLVLTYNEALDNVALMAESFTVNVGGSPVAVTNVAMDAATGKVTLTLATAVQPNQAVTVSYADASNGSTPIQDAAGNDAASLTNQPVTNNSGDTLAPTLTSAMVTGTSLVLTYNEALDNVALMAESFTVNVGGSPVAVTNVAMDAATGKVTLTLATAVQPNQAVTVSYADASNGSTPIQDAAGNDAASLTNQPVTNNSGDTLAPTLTSAVVTGTSLVLTYSEALDGDAPAAGSFTVNVGGSPVAVTNVAIDAATGKVTLTLASAVQPNQLVTVSYADVSGGTTPIQDAAGNDAANVDNQVVVNSSADTLAPTLASAVVTGASLVLTYSEVLDAIHGPDADDFVVMVDGQALAVNAVAIDPLSTVVRLTLANPVQPGQVVTVSYTDPTDFNDGLAIQDMAGNDAASLVDQAVTNDSADTLAPAFVSAAVNGRTLVMRYSEALDGSHAPSASAFAVSVGGSQVAVNGVAIDAVAGTVTLTLASSVQQGQAVTVSYTDPTDGNDDHAIQDAAGNDAADVVAQQVTNNTPAEGGGNPPVNPPVNPPASGTVDGVKVVTEQVRNPDGSTSTRVTVPVVTASREEQVGNNDVADIPLATNAAGGNLLLAQLPVGFGMTSLGSGIKTAGDALTDLIREIKAHTAAGSTDQEQLTGGGSGFLGELASSTNLLVQTIVPTFGASTVPSAPLAITGLPSTPGNPLTALVIDSSGLPAGTSIKLDNVDFAALIGAVSVSGGAGAQKVWGDSASQTIFLGEGDDILHGGGGNDIVGSAGGNDRVYGDEGDDIVFGGEGDDYVDGGSGHDIAIYSGAGREGYSLRVKDGQLIMKDLHGGDGTDTVVDVEVLRFTGAPADTTVRGTVARLIEAASGAQASDAAIDTWLDALGKGADTAAVARSLLAANGLDKLGNAGFIDALYGTVLGRETDPAGKAYWVAALDAGRVDKAGAALLIVDSAEKIALGQSVDLDFNHSDVATLARMYETLFARHADEGGLNFWIGVHESGASMTQVADYFIASDEASAKYGALTDAQFVDALYLSAFDRTGSSGEQTFWLDGLSSGQLDRGDVLLGFAESQEMLTLVGTINTSIPMA